MPENISIRKFRVQDREGIRQISVDTAFNELPAGRVFSDTEILSDALTLYHTDYEPQSCFVALDNDLVIGYIIGTTDAKLMERVNSGKILPYILWKAFRRGVFFKIKNIKFFFLCMASVTKGEFFAPEFSREYPAMLHINIAQDYRGKGIGQRLIRTFEEYLRENKVIGVHFGTISDAAKEFFLKMGYSALFKGKRSYMRPYTGRDANFYVFGKKL